MPNLSLSLSSELLLGIRQGSVQLWQPWLGIHRSNLAGDLNASPSEVPETKGWSYSLLLERAEVVRESAVWSSS